MNKKRTDRDDPFFLQFMLSRGDELYVLLTDWAFTAMFICYHA